MEETSCLKSRRWVTMGILIRLMFYGLLRPGEAFRLRPMDVTFTIGPDGGRIAIVAIVSPKTAKVIGAGRVQSVVIYDLGTVRWLQYLSVSSQRKTHLVILQRSLPPIGCLAHEDGWSWPFRIHTCLGQGRWSNIYVYFGIVDGSDFIQREVGVHLFLAQLFTRRHRSPCLGTSGSRRANSVLSKSRPLPCYFGEPPATYACWPQQWKLK